MHGWIWGLMALCFAAPVAAKTVTAKTVVVADRGCAVLAARVDAIPGRGPVFLPSYDGVEAEPALAGAAFTYDNALAVIALTSCGKPTQALRLGEALLAGVAQDRAGAQGRLRNAYRAGAQDGPPLPHGWWDGSARRWAEDPMQVGTATGNAAWAGLALLTLAEATGQPRFADGAARLAGWAVEHTASGSGFTGGIHGDGAGAQRLGWKSTEHNVDLAALFTWLARTQPRWNAPAQSALAFVAGQWQPGSGHFLTGTLPDGVSPNRATSGLDAQLWPLLLDGAPESWRQALDYAGRAHKARNAPMGLDFNDDGDGVWWEGSAQAALAYGAAGRQGEADRLLAALEGQFSPGGYIWATSTPRLTTGLALSPGSTSDDFYYYRRPHLAPTAWAVLAAKRWNPFTGRRF